MLFILLLTLLFTSCSATINQLSFSGGGSFGAVEIGIIKRLMERNGKKQFDLYTGISAGALNAGFLSYFKNIGDGIRVAERIYTSINNRMVYKLLPTTGVSVLNTEPLFNTLNAVISRMPGEPVIHTLIGATNLYSGNLDVYAFESTEDKVHLLMSSSAIPGLFPPIDFNGTMYADGGTLSNELLQVEHSGGEYINITFITPYEGYVYDNEPIDSLEKMIKRTISIVTSNFNNPLATLNQNCANPIGEINKYYVDPALLEGYSILNFDDGKELIDIGYNGVRQKKYKLC
jgi:predicted patatin/cPLA2 family phospholipase